MSEPVWSNQRSGRSIGGDGHVVTGFLLLILLLILIPTALPHRTCDFETCQHVVAWILNRSERRKQRASSSFPLLPSVQTEF